MSNFVLTGGIKPEDFEILIQSMGVQKIYQGDELIYQRKSSHCYIYLDTSESAPEEN